MNIKPNADPFILLNAVQEEMFTIIRLSPDFLPAQETLASLAGAVSPQSPKLAREVVSRLQQIKLEEKQTSH
jgi:hypothetical protein